MDQLTAAAAVVGMAIDDDGPEDSELEDAPDPSVADGIGMPDDDAMGVGKENEGDLPED